MEFKATYCEFSESGLLCFIVISILSAFQGFTGRHMRTQLFVQNLLKVRRVRVFQFVQETHISCSWIERNDCYETARVETLHLCAIDHEGIQLQAPTQCSLLVSVFDAVILVPIKLHWDWHISDICHPVSSKLLIASLATSLDLAVTQSAKGVNINILEKCMCSFYLDFYMSCSCLIICMPHFRYG
jgi:hypothetical protein